MAKYKVAIDVGGTFTDLVAMKERTAETLNIKVPSTPRKPAKAIIKALQKFATKTKNAETSIIIHATTIATNALLGQLNLELPKTALIATTGFRDVIEIRRQRRHELYNLFIQKPPALVPRRYRFEVDERIGPKGKILVPVNQNQVENLAEEIAREKVRSIAVTLLFSYINQKHEREIERILKKRLPRIYVSLSSEIAPEYREYERTSTAVVNAVLMPIISSYLGDLQRRIGELGIKAPLYTKTGTSEIFLCI